MERRDFFKVATASLASLALTETFPEIASAVNTINPIVNLPKSDVPRMAWTVDDGCSNESVQRYIEFAIEHDLRLTFFVYSAMAPWKTNVKLLKPLVDSGQIQLANHSHTHPDLTLLSRAEVQDELMKCHRFIEKNYGVDARPFFRAPYGAINRTVIQAAADIGYTKPMSWSGTLADAGKIKAGSFMYRASVDMQDRGILLGHANNLVASQHFDQLLQIVNDRSLSLVTLKDVFG